MKWNINPFEKGSPAKNFYSDDTNNTDASHITYLQENMRSTIVVRIDQSRPQTHMQSYYVYTDYGEKYVMGAVG